MGEGRRGVDVSRAGLSIGGIETDYAVHGREEMKGIAYAQEHRGHIAVPAP